MLLVYSLGNYGYCTIHFLYRSFPVHCGLSVFKINIYSSTLKSLLVKQMQTRFGAVYILYILQFYKYKVSGSDEENIYHMTTIYYYFHLLLFTSILHQSTTSTMSVAPASSLSVVLLTSSPTPANASCVADTRT